MNKSRLDRAGFGLDLKSSFCPEPFHWATELQYNPFSRFLPEPDIPPGWFGVGVSLLSGYDLTCFQFNPKENIFCHIQFYDPYILYWDPNRMTINILSYHKYFWIGKFVIPTNLTL